jgi:hypothetical protein
LLPLDASRRRSLRRHSAGRLDHLHHSLWRRQELGMLLEKSSNQLTQRGSNISRQFLAVACILFTASGTHAQNRGVYPLGMSALNSGIRPSLGSPTRTSVPECGRRGVFRPKFETPSEPPPPIRSSGETSPRGYYPYGAAPNFDTVPPAEHCRSGTRDLSQLTLRLRGRLALGYRSCGVPRAA